MRTVCRLTHIPAERIRYYADQGILGEIERRQADGQEGERLFSREQIERLCFIDRWTAAGWTLKAIRSVLKDKDGMPVDELMQRLAREIHEKTAQLEELRNYSCDPGGWLDRETRRDSFDHLVVDAEIRLGQGELKRHALRRTLRAPRRRGARDVAGRTPMRGTPVAAAD